VLCSFCNLKADVPKKRPSVQFKVIVIQEKSGFRKGRSFTDSDFTSKCIISLNKDFNIPTHATFKKVKLSL
jgi:hypothetical protein